MNKSLKASLLLLVLLFFVLSNAALGGKVLGLIQVIQEKSQWCWAAVSRAVLYFYGSDVAQCTIAEYTRQKASWHDFGSVNCCVDPDQGCDYWNYFWAYPGGIEDILYNWGIQSSRKYSYLSKPEITAVIDDNRPFIFRWGWTSGGGHFLVGHGIENNDLYYMDPWFGEGLKIADYDWIVSGGSHDWTHTLVMTSQTDVPEYELTISTTNGGTTSPAPGIHTYKQNTQVQITAYPDTYYQFYEWTLDAEGRTNPVLLTMNSDKFIHAVFKKIYAPLNFRGEKVLNRSLSQAEYITILSWEKNPVNENIAGYKIYIEENQSWQLLVEIDASTREYRHRNVEEKKHYNYRLVAVTVEGSEGEPSSATVK